MTAMQQFLGWHSIIDWLTVIALLLVGVIAAIVWLGWLVHRQFQHHDHDLRAEVERVNHNFRELLRRTGR